VQEPFGKRSVSGEKGVRHGLESDRRELEAVQGPSQGEVGRLTDDDLDVISGRREQLEGKIQERYGLAKDQAKQDVDAWSNSLTNIT
jgi:uncharacterized protein YjbJ (UPF0337 family)